MKPQLDLTGKAYSTRKGENRFRFKVYIRVTGEIVRITNNYRDSDESFTILGEYPTYEEELATKKENTKVDEITGNSILDTDAIAIWRVKRCLIKWNLHKVKGFAKKLIRVNNLLTDDSFQSFIELPPLVRKHILQRLWLILGPP
jgi:hypothetical protein